MTMPTHRDREGLHLDDPGAITTASGLRVNPVTLDETDIRLEDIARSLSAQVRYNGHTHGHLSVARHCLWVAERVEPQHRLWALLHDAAEAYIGDLVRPLKHTAYGANYLDHEAFIEEAIADHFGLPFPMPEAIREADRTVLAWEMSHARWSYDGNAADDEREWLCAVLEAQGRACTLPKPTTEIIGLMGYAQSGKDTTGKYLVETYGFQRISFATPVYDAAYAMNPLIPVPFSAVPMRLQALVDEVGWDTAKLNPEVRAVLQRVGTEAGRNIHGQNVWINLAMAKVKPGGKYVFTDVRFPNEADAIQAAGGKLWRVVRPGTGPVNNHDSEVILDRREPDMIVRNNDGIDDLQQLVCALLAVARGEL